MRHSVHYKCTQFFFVHRSCSKGVDVGGLRVTPAFAALRFIESLESRVGEMLRLPAHMNRGHAFSLSGVKLHVLL